MSALTSKAVISSASQTRPAERSGDVHLGVLPTLCDHSSSALEEALIRLGSDRAHLERNSAAEQLLPFRWQWVELSAMCVTQQPLQTVLAQEA